MRLKLIAGFVIVAAVAAAIVVVRRDAVVAEWQVASVSEDRRSLKIQINVREPYCGDDLRVRVSSATAQVITIAASMSAKGCTDQGRTNPPVIEVRLKAPITGQQIAGEGKSLKRFAVAQGERGVVPRVVGLRFADAAAALNTAGFSKIERQSVGDVVTSQRPEAETEVKLRTDSTTDERATLTVE